jgi:hypothetical protein
MTQKRLLRLDTIFLDGPILQKYHFPTGIAIIPGIPRGSIRSGTLLEAKGPNGALFRLWIVR